MRIIKFCSPVIGLSLLMGCGGKSGGGSSDSDSGGGSGGVSSNVTSLKDLSLTGVLAISLPDSIKGNGTAASLKLAGQKSFEACQLRDQMREALSNIAMIKTQFCFIENDPVIAFGKKYNIDFSAMSGGGAGGPGNQPPPMPGLRQTPDGMPSSMQIWIDNSAGEKITIYMCQDKKLSQMISVTGAKAGVAKGSMVMKQSLGGMEFHRTLNFDNKYTSTDRTTVTIKELIKMSQEGVSFSARRLLSLSLSDAGVSKALASYTGDMGDGGTSFASIGAFDKDFGSVIAKGSASFSGQPMTFSNESFFDGKSYVVDPANHPSAFGENGKVALKADAVPGFLGASFTPEEFPADAWDCSGTEDVSIGGAAPSGGADSGASACMESWNELSEESCHDTGMFTQGSEVQIDESAQVDAEKFEGFSEQ